MLLKNLIVLAGLIWFTASYAKDPIMGEDIDDALVQKFEEPVVRKNQNRDVAQAKKKAAPAEEATAPELKYWKYQEEPGSKD